MHNACYSVPLDSNYLILHNMDYSPKIHLLNEVSKCPVQLCLSAWLTWPRSFIASSGISLPDVLSDVRRSGQEESALCYKDTVCRVAAEAQSARENTASKGALSWQSEA